MNCPNSKAFKLLSLSLKKKKKKKAVGTAAVAGFETVLSQQ